tara:strand:+ start:4053 stop:4166 length:114 start_codon:yes stop_codon:yes gene_type:complete
MACVFSSHANSGMPVPDAVGERLGVAGEKARNIRSPG